MRRAALAAASAVLSAGTALRRRLHGAGLLRTRSLPAPVISVGNLSAGGAGKTPLVEHCVRVLRELGARPVVLARGYGGPVGGTGLNDEGCVLAENLPGLPQYQDPDRFAAGSRALAEKAGDCFVLDDAFQHLRLARDLDVVAVDARDPFRGGLRREGRGGLRRAGFVVLTRAARAGEAGVAAARAALERLSPDLPFFLAVTDHAPSSVRPLGGGAEEPPDSLRGAAVFAAAGIADPAALVQTLEALGARVLGSRGFPDHGLATPADLDPALDEARRLGAERVVVTQKDAVKIAAAGGIPPSPPVSVLGIRLAFRSGERELREQLEDALRRGRNRALGVTLDPVEGPLGF